MKLDGFIGPAYTLDSVQVDAQRCVNLYPEVIESGKGKEGQVAYLKSTPGIEKLLEVGSGPIRMIHTDSIGRAFIASGSKMYMINQRSQWTVTFRPTAYVARTVVQSSGINTSTDVLTSAGHGFYTGLKVQVASSDTLPGGLAATTDYWVIRVDADTFKLAENLPDALADTEINITSTGSGDLTVTPQIPDPLYKIPYSPTINAVDDSFFYEAHGFYTGLKVTFATTGLYPSPLASGVTYYVLRLNANEFQLAASLADAAAGITLVNTDLFENTYEVDEDGAARFNNKVVVGISSFPHLSADTDRWTMGTGSHGFQTGDALLWNHAFAGTPPTPDVPDGAIRYAIKVTDVSFQLATTKANALAGIYIDFTAIGNQTYDVTRREDFRAPNSTFPNSNQTTPAGFAVARTTSSPITGTGSLLITKDSTDGRWLGVNLATFAVPAIARNRNVTVNYKLNITTAPADNTMRFYAYDNTAQAPITFSSSNLPTTTGTYSITFFMPAGCQDCSIGLFGYNWTTPTSALTAAWSFRLDDIACSVSTVVEGGAGTEIELTAGNPNTIWNTVELASDGTEGGDEEGLASSLGAVNAASMSAFGDGSDSSTVFVDGVNNYLFMDDPSLKIEAFGSLGDGQSAEVTATKSGFDDIEFTTVEDAPSLDGKKLFVSSILDNDLALGQIRIAISKTSGSPTASRNDQIYLDIFCRDTSVVTMSTAELAEFLNTGAVSGRPEISRIATKRSMSLLTFNQFFGLRASGGSASELAIGSTGFFSATVTVSGDYYAATTTVSNEYFWTINGFTAFGYNSVEKATHIVWIDGYFIVNEGGTNKFYVSDLKGFNIDTLSFTSAEGAPDTIVALSSNHRDLWVFGEQSIEVYTNTGNADFPFERISGGFLEVGCAAGYSVAKIDGTILWLGRSEQGEGQVFAARGMTPQRVSTHAIEQAIASYANPSAAVAYTYESKGHKFYVLSFAEATWVYDLSTGLWHERAFTNGGVLERHRGFACAYSAKAKAHLVGDYQNNKVYIMTDDHYMDDDQAITRLRSSPHVSSGLDRVFCPKFQLDMQTGVGLDGSGQGSDPQAMLDWSDDGGHTWSSEVWSSLGKTIGGIGEFTKRVIWRRLGSFRDRIFRVKITDPVKVNIISADIDVEKGSN